MSNRELALFIWIGIVLVLMLWNGDLRSSLLGLAWQALNPKKLLVPILSLLAYIGLLVFFGSRVGLWHRDLLAQTVIWTVASALGLLFSVNRIANDPRFFKHAALGAFTLGVFFEFYFGLVVFNLLIELIMLPVLVILVVLSAVAGTKDEYKQAKQVADVLMSLIGLVLFVYVTVRLATTWHQVDALRDLRVLALPMWLTLGLLPFVFIVSLYSGYQSAFLRIDWATEDEQARRRGKLALLLGLNLHTRHINRFEAPWPHRLAEASSRAKAKEVTAEFKLSDLGSGEEEVA